MIFVIAHTRFKFRENERLKPMNEVVEIVELSIDQQNTIDQSFKSEYLKDEILY